MSYYTEMIYLGTGSAFGEKNLHTNALITWYKDSTKNSVVYRLLIDAGSDIKHSLPLAGLSVKDIDGVYISHQHGDHCGGLETLGFKSYFDPTRERKIQLFISNKLVDDIWNKTMSGGMESLAGKSNTLETYFDVKSIADNGSFVVLTHRFDLVQMIHIVNDRMVVPAFGLMIESPLGLNWFLTTDTQHNPNQISEYYNKADVIIHDCETGFKSGVHAHWTELATLPLEVREKIWLSHFTDDVLDGTRWHDWAAENKFKGFVLPRTTIFDLM